jgi:nucleoside recognition membrane protein YjiH
MIDSKNVVSALRRDVAFVWHAVIAVVFIGFASLAVAAALLDLWSIRH